MTEKGTCKHCGKYGHDDSNYYELIGYPTNWDSHGRGRNRGGRRGYGGRATGVEVDGQAESLDTVL